MFENFSFTSPSSNMMTGTLSPPLSDSVEPSTTLSGYQSSMISPLSSPCPSPTPGQGRSSTYPPLSQRPQNHYHSRHPNRLSVGALTQKLHAHTLQPSPQVSPDTTSFSDPLTPPYAGDDVDDVDEGFAEPESYFPNSNPFDVDIMNMNYDILLTPPTSSPSPASINRRHYRQLLTRLQCMASTTDALNLAMLLEEKHPSEILVGNTSPTSAASGSGSRRPSVTSVGRRVEKRQSPGAAVRRKSSNLNGLAAIAAATTDNNGSTKASRSRSSSRAGTGAVVKKMPRMRRKGAESGVGRR